MSSIAGGRDLENYLVHGQTATAGSGMLAGGTSAVSDMTTSHLTSGRLLARNTIWNIAGQLLPLAVGVVAVPPLVRLLGVDRFGLLSLAWIIIGYFSLFDLGMGRALTKLVADKLGAKQEESIPPLVWTSLMLLLLLGAVGGLVTWSISPWLVLTALKVPSGLQAETLRSFELLAGAIPIVTVTSGLRGILEALQRFRLLNFIRIPMGAFSFVGPLLVLPFSHSLVPVVTILVFGRLIACAAHLLACLHSLPALRHGFCLRQAVILPLLRFGGWMTVSNIVSPLMASMDRFLVGALLSVSAVAYYTAPFDLVSRLTFIPQGIAGVLFPAFAVSLAQDSDRAVLLVSRGVKYIFLTMFPLILMMVAFAPEGLQLWLGSSFSHHSQAVLRWLGAGVLINSLASIPFALIQGAGRPSVTAKLHLFELPVYLFAVWALAKHFGIAGTAVAWTGRVTLDAILLFFFCQRLLPKARFLWKLAATMAAALLILYSSTLIEAEAIKVVFAILILFIFAFASWSWGIASDERQLVFRRRSPSL